MYDWITASMDITSHNHKKYIDKMITISEVKTFYTDTTWSNGYLFNGKSGRKMGVSISDKRIKIKICPNKYILGNNIQEAPIKNVLETLDNISNILGLDLGLFVLEKLDVTHTAQTEFIPEMYYSYLCNNNGFTRWHQDTSLYYKGNSHKVTKVFYDKVNEVINGKKKTWGGKQTIPHHLKDKNLTRFECRLGTNKEINKVIGNGSFLGQLFLEEHIEQLQNWWWNQYNQIPKTTEMNWEFLKDMGEKKIKETINFLAYKSLGRLQIEQLIELADKASAFKHRSQKTRLKDYLLGRFDTCGKKHNHIKELDKKFKEIEPIWD
jgi:hypothetical protein